MRSSPITIILLQDLRITGHDIHQNISHVRLELVIDIHLLHELLFHQS